MISVTVKFFPGLRTALGAMVVVCLLVPQVVSAEEFAAATTVPKSESELWGKLVVPDGTEFLFKIHDGGMLRIEEEGTGKVWSLVGFIDKDPVDGKERFVFHEYSITEHPSGEGEVIQWLGSEFELTPNDEWSRSRELDRSGFQVELTRVVAKPGTEKSTDLFTEPPVTATSTCCVSCSGYTICGCSVSAPCGSCCAGACCGGCGIGSNCGPLDDSDNP